MSDTIDDLLDVVSQIAYGNDVMLRETYMEAANEHVSPPPGGLEEALKATECGYLEQRENTFIKRPLFRVTELGRTALEEREQKNRL